MGPQYVRPEYFISKHHCQHLIFYGRVVFLSLIEGFTGIVYSHEYLFSFVTPRNPWVSLTTRQCTEYLGITYRDTTISCPIHGDPFMPIYFIKIYKFIKTVPKSLSYNSLILHVKSSFFSKRFLKAIVRLSSHLRSRMRVSHLYITCTKKGVPR